MYEILDDIQYDQKMGPVDSRHSFAYLYPSNQRPDLTMAPVIIFAWEIGI